MSSVVGALRAEALKLRHTFFYWTHVALPLLAAGCMLAYFAGTNGRELWQITAYVELLGIALPIVVSLVCGMAVEVETDNHFQVFLGGRAHKGTAYLYKSLWLMLCGFGALVLAMVLFGVCYDDLLDKSSTDFLIIFSYLRKCWKGLLYQTFPAFCVSEDTPHIMAFRSLIWHWKVVKP